MATLGLMRRDFEAFAIEDFDTRVAKIYEHVTPRLFRLGVELAPQLSRGLQMEFFPHVAKHIRRTVNPPDESWTAFGPSRAGYKRHGYLALYISGAGIHARAVVKSEADNRRAMGRLIKSKSAELARSFRGTRIQQYLNWDRRRLPDSTVAGADFFEGLGDALEKKTGGIDVGFGWPVRDALKVDHAEVLDAFRELGPLYRVIRSVAS
jgi:uncharacterized protein YktB (UPF0637 family)